MVVPLAPLSSSRRTRATLAELGAIASHEDNLHLAVVVLSVCGSSQLVHLARAHAPSLTTPAVDEYDHAQWSWLQEHVLDGLIYDGFLEAVLSLPCRKSGLGIRPVRSFTDQAVVGALALGATIFADAKYIPVSARGL